MEEGNSYAVSLVVVSAVELATAYYSSGKVVFRSGIVIGVEGVSSSEVLFSPKMGETSAMKRKRREKCFIFKFE